MATCYLGIDIGGTKSHALIADSTGRALGLGAAGPGSYEVVGFGGLERVLRELTNAALAEAGLAPADIAGAGFGIAGYDWPGEREPHLRAIETLGLSAPFELVNDTIVGLLAGAAEGWGVALVAGTSNNCRGLDAAGREGRITGQGAWFGEYGGAVELVRRALEAVSAAWSLRGPQTALSAALVEAAGAAGVEDLFEGLVLRRYKLDAECARAVFAVAERGDAVARACIAWAGRELGSLACGVIRQLGFEGASFDLVLVGGLYNGGPLLIDPLRETVHALAPGARLVRLEAPPVVGGVLLGMRAAGLDPAPLRPALIASARALFAR